MSEILEQAVDAAPIVESAPVETSTVETTIPTETPTEPQPASEIKEQETPVKPFELPVAHEADPFEKLTLEQVADRYRDKKTDLIKALGYDDFVSGLLDYYEKEKDLTPYLEVKTVDYTKMPDIQIVERKLKEQYAKQGLSDEAVKLLVEDDMAAKFKLDEVENSEREVAISKARLQAEAAEYRKVLMERQQAFKAPEPAAQPAATPPPTYEEVVQSRRQNLIKDAAVQQFLTNKKLQFGDTQSPFNLEISDPEETLSVIYDTNKYLYYVGQKNEQGQLLMQNGEPVLDPIAMLETAAFIRDRKSFVNNLIAYGKTLGTKQVIEEAENVMDNRTHGATSEPEDLYKAFERRLNAR